jgi:hypothetical protein
MNTYRHSIIHTFIHSCLIIVLLGMNVYSQTILDNFESIADWKVYKADGVDIEISPAEGYEGNGIRLDYNFTKGSGYGGFQKIIPLDLPENFQFTFYLKAESPSNNFEFKLLDESGENVWWVNNRNYDFPTEWIKIKIKKRHINFAWGPTKDKSLKKIDRIEFTIASYVGGKGAVYIDEFKFEELPPEDNSPIIPIITASSELNENFSVKNISDNNPETEWRSSDNENQNIILDLTKRREIGGLVIDWDKEDYAKDFDIYLSTDNKEWGKVYSVKDARGYKSYIRLVEEDASYIKIDLLKSSCGDGYSIKEISVKNVDYSADINRFFINIAKDNPRGYYPRYFNEEASFWTVVGVNNDIKEALINEDGMVEVDKKGFSIEPFLFIDDKLVTWNDVEREQSLAGSNLPRINDKYLPVPSVILNYDNLILETKIFAAGEANENSILYIKYRLRNYSNQPKKGNLYLAVRPFQVNPYYQWLNITGGATEISSIKYEDNKAYINDDKVIIPVTIADGFGAASFDEGDITFFLNENRIPNAKTIFDERKSASAVLHYSFNLRSGEGKNIYLAVPFYKYEIGNSIKPFDITITEKYVNELLTGTFYFWNNKINHVKFNLPQSADKIINTWKSNLAYILINRDNAGIQPGSRSYERSWIRDGSLTSSALLKSGIIKEVKEFIEWYAPYQFENGKVPCVVDTRGPDPVPEHDSHGQLIFLIKQYFNFTKDTSFLAAHNKYVINAVNYMQEIIAERSTDHFKYGNDSVRAYYGILPESISHEGYSEKPMHSYWDNFFAMKGLKDAANIQLILGNTNEYERISAIRDKFKTDLYNSIRLAMKTRNIDYIPGCVELGDFDATSTTIALYPVNELPNLPQPELENTFSKYYKYFTDRRDGKIEWIAYTPYEVRTIGSFIFLDKPEIAHELIDFFIKDQRPQGWNHWAEVVWKDERHPGFIGDMPHTWVGSDFINAIRTMFVYENEYDSSLVVGTALYQDWIDSPNGMSVENLPTYYGELGYSINKDQNKYTVNIYGDVGIPSGGIILKNFNGAKMPKQVLINGNETKDFSENKIVIKEFPANVEIKY